MIIPVRELTAHKTMQSVREPGSPLIPPAFRPSFYCTVFGEIPLIWYLNKSVADLNKSIADLDNFGQVITTAKEWLP